MIDNSKRNFFKRVKTPFSFLISPPYYEDKSRFVECYECETKACVEACEEKIIFIENEVPVLKFNNSGCSFCDECAVVCEKNVLDIEFKKSKLNCEIFINPKKCISWNQTICFACLDVCDVRAIKFKGMFNPIIDEEICTSCGMCVSVCPTNSLEILRKEENV